MLLTYSVKISDPQIFLTSVHIDVTSNHSELFSYHSLPTSMPVSGMVVKPKHSCVMEQCRLYAVTAVTQVKCLPICFYIILQQKGNLS